MSDTENVPLVEAAVEATDVVVEADVVGEATDVPATEESAESKDKNVEGNFKISN